MNNEQLKDILIAKIEQDKIFKTGGGVYWKNWKSNTKDKTRNTENGKTTKSRKNKNERRNRKVNTADSAEEIVKIYLDGVEMSLRVIQDFFLFLFIFFIIYVIITSIKKKRWKTSYIESEDYNDKSNVCMFR